MTESTPSQATPLDIAFQTQAQAKWATATGSRYILGKQYPIEVTLNGKTHRFAAHKDSGSGPLKLARLGQTKYGPVFVMYKIGKDGILKELGTKNLFAMTNEAKAINIKEFESLFTNPDLTESMRNDANTEQRAKIQASKKDRMEEYAPSWDTYMHRYGSRVQAAFAHGWNHVKQEEKGYTKNEPDPTDEHLGDLKIHYLAGKAAAAAYKSKPYDMIRSGRKCPHQRSPCYAARRNADASEPDPSSAKCMTQAHWRC